MMEEIRSFSTGETVKNIFRFIFMYISRGVARLTARTDVERREEATVIKPVLQNCCWLSRKLANS